MIAVQIILIAVGALLADADECSCSCNKEDVCEEQNTLRMEHYANTAEIEKWNRHYEFVRDFDKDWQSEVARVSKEQLEVKMDETLEGLRDTSQNEELIAKIESLENSMREREDQVNELNFTMNMLSGAMNGIRTESHRTQHEPKCGVNLNSDGSNEEGNTNSVLVWPWMAAVYRNSDSELVCGGSVIHRHFVLTSAWCVTDYESDELSVKLGLSDLKDRTHLQEYRVQSTHLHPQFKNGSRYNNFDYSIALLELEEAIPFGPFARPVCLPPPESSVTECPKLGSPLLESRTEDDGTRTWTQVGIQSGSVISGISDCQYIVSPRLDHLRAWVDDTIEASCKGINGCIRNTEAEGELPTPKRPSLSETVTECSDNVEEGACFLHEGGYLTLHEKFHVGSKISIAFDIKPRNLSGILMAVHGKRDYLILQMVDGRVVVSVDNGVGPIRAVYEPQSSRFLGDGQWHTIQVIKIGNVVSLAVDDVFQDPGIGDGAVKSADTKDKLYVGGVPESSLSKSGVETREQFVGCIRFLELNQTRQSLSQARVTGQVTLSTCPTI